MAYFSGGTCSCKEMTSVTIPDSVNFIDEYAFYTCENLATVELGKGVTRIAVEAFSMTGITSVTIPDSVQIIEAYAFQSCYKLATVLIGGGVTLIRGGAFGLTALSGTVVVPRATHIDDAAFPSTVTIVRRVRPPQYNPSTRPPMATPTYYCLRACLMNLNYCRHQCPTGVRPK